jgi:hypothetical protein
MNTKAVSWILYLLLAICMFITIGALIYLMPSTTNKINPISNPTEGKSSQEISDNFNEYYIFYLLYNLNANELNNIPLSSNTPKIKIITEDKTYNAEIVNSEIILKETLTNEDIQIKTTKQEIIKMIENQSYIKESFNNGDSNLVLIASKTTLFTKGYKKIYDSIK